MESWEDGGGGGCMGGVEKVEGIWEGGEGRGCMGGLEKVEGVWEAWRRWRVYGRGGEVGGYMAERWRL